MNDYDKSNYHNISEALAHLLESTYRVWWKYGADKDWNEWLAVREALLEVQACKFDLMVAPEYFLEQKKEDVLTR
ncbi:MAG: hypothetical protein NUV80_07370 [Candidatus Berkelbacteria bacterium]|nr:hypothetical protein [Candidatus Berkelbacteria bacterium]